MLISIGLLTLASCGNSTPAISSTTSQNTPTTTTPTSTPTTTSEASSQSTSTTTITPEDITIEIPTVYTIDSQDNESIPVIEYTGAPINIPFTAPEGCTSTIQYKLKGAQDSEYTTTAPKDLGEYEIMVTVTPPNSTTPIVVKKDIKIGIDFLGDYKQYENTSAYRKVSSAEEFLEVLYDAKYTYTTTSTGLLKSEGYDTISSSTVRQNESQWKKWVTRGIYLKDGDDYVRIPSNTAWNPDDTVYTNELTYYKDIDTSRVTFEQELTKEGKVKVIELTCDLDLGYNLIKDLGASSSTFMNWDKNHALEDSTKYYKDPDIKASGISQIKVENMTDLLIYSKNGAKITHAGFNVLSCKDVSFRNLEMDEIWMWEDSTTTDLTKIGDYDAAPWAYFKISHSENVWIDHCTFGKSFDGQIDFANPVYDSYETLSRAPYGGTGANGLKVTYCDFKAGSDDPDGYLYKMMEKIEQEYQVYAADKTNYVASEKTCRYYFNLRDSGKSFTTIMNVYAIPQKKAFLWCDSGDKYAYNKYMVAILANCTIKNIETRLPKVRGGMAYVYNVLVDNTEYFKANKYGNVSEGILSGLDASIYLESVEYKGIKNYLKNNDSTPDAGKGYPTVNGGYMIKNSVLGTIVGSTDKENNTDPFLSVNSTTSKLSIGNFAFKVNGEKTDLTEPPFEIDAYKLVEDGEQVGSLEDYFIEHPTGVLR